MASEQYQGPAGVPASGGSVTNGADVGQHSGSAVLDTGSVQPNGATRPGIKAASSTSNLPQEEKALAEAAAAQKAARKKKMIRWSIVAFVALLAVVAAITAPIVVHEKESSGGSSSGSGSGSTGGGSSNSSSSKPNIVFIMTDDQDVHMDSLSYMHGVQSLLVQQGTTYTAHYCTVALCCPSRVNLWTGRAAHNTNVTDLGPPYGGYPKFASQGLNDAWLPVWMQAAGYRTYYVGKLMNSHSTENYNDPYAAGFDGSEFLLEPGTYSYWNPIFQRNHDAPINHTNEYNTDLVTSKALAFLDDAVATGDPFMLTITPIAPHANVEFTNSGLNVTYPEANTQFQNVYSDAQVPRTPNFNPDKASGAAWIATLPQQTDENVAGNDKFYRHRIRSLQSVDDLVNQTIAKLEAHGILDNTYIFYSTDNGYHIGQHRLQPGKSCGIETDVNIPLIVRGPNVAKNWATNIVSSHTDLAPTFLGIAGQQPRDDFDGAAIPLTQDGCKAQQNDGADEHVNIEFWGNAPSEGYFNSKSFPNNTYKALRLIGNNYSFYYSVWCTGDHELYDMVADPYQMNNLYEQTDVKLLSNTAIVSDVKNRLDALMMVLKSCKADSCISPWKQLHPDGSVKTLPAALNTKYNSFYQTQSNVTFDRCDKGYIIDSEGPMQFNVFGSHSAMVREFNNPDWSELA